MSEPDFNVPPPTNEVGMHVAIHLLESQSCAILISEPLDVTLPLIHKYSQLLGTQVVGERKYDCVLLLNENQSVGLFTVDPSTKLLLRHPKLPLTGSIEALFIQTTHNRGWLCLSGTAEGRSSWQNLYTTELQMLFDQDRITQSRLKRLEQMMETLMKAMRDVYYAPNMPGFVAAASNFATQSTSCESCNKKRKLE